jgi:membrane protease YdiL (CAAX protease family)
MQDEAAAILGTIVLALLVASALVWAGIIGKLWRGEPLAEFEPRSQVPWSAADLAVLFVVFLLCQVVAAVIVGGEDSEAVISPGRLLAASVAHLVWLAIAVVYLVARSGAYYVDLGFDTSRLARDLRLGGLALLAALVPVYAVQWFFVEVLQMPSEHPVLQLTQDHPGPAVLVVATIAAVFAAPLFEEFVFRVALQGWLESRDVERRRLWGSCDERPGYAPVVISAAIFALPHLAHGPDPAALFVLALALGYVYRQTHRIFPSLAIHAGFNALAIGQLWIMFFTSA